MSEKPHVATKRDQRIARARDGSRAPCWPQKCLHVLVKPVYFEEPLMVWTPFGHRWKVDRAEIPREPMRIESTQPQPTIGTYLCYLAGRREPDLVPNDSDTGVGGAALRLYAYVGMPRDDDPFSEACAWQPQHDEIEPAERFQDACFAICENTPSHPGAINGEASQGTRRTYANPHF
eukprot:9504029-Pyramimonas_sp.AAC.1